MKHVGLLSGLCLLLVLASCGDGKKIERVSAKQFATIITADQATKLDPMDTQGGNDVKVIIQMYETLIRTDPDDIKKLKGVLAKSWEVSDDGLTIVLKIRENVKFHDGAKLDAEAVRLSLERLRGNYLDVPSCPYRPEYKAISKIVADDMTLTLTLTFPCARIVLNRLTNFPSSIISPKLLKETEGMEVDSRERSKYIADRCYGTGPYTLADFDTSAHKVRMVAFEDYWGGAPAIKTILYKSIPEQHTRFGLLKSNEVEVVDDIARPQWKEVKGNMRLEDWWALNICYLGMNAHHEKTKDKKLRRALQLAVDRSEIVSLYYGTARPTYSLVAQPMAEYDHDYRAPDTEKSVEDRRTMAAGLVKAAGAEGRTLKIYYPEQARPYLPTPKKVADKLRQQFNQIGLMVDIQGVPNTELFESVSQGIYELVLIGWMADIPDPDNFYSPLIDGSGPGEPSAHNTSRECDGEIHEKILKAQTLKTLEDRIVAYREIEHLLQTKVVGYIPLVNTKQAIAFTNSIEGVEIDSGGNYRLFPAKLKK